MFLNAELDSKHNQSLSVRSCLPTIVTCC